MTKLTAAATAALALVALAGCSGSDDPAANPSLSPSLGLPEASPSETFAGPPDGVTVTELDEGPVGLTAVGGEVWAALIDAGEVRTGDDTRIPVGTAPLRLVSTPDGVWVSVISDGKVVRIDPETGKVDLTVKLKPAGSEPEGLAYDGSTLWVVDQANDRVVPMTPGRARSAPPSRPVTGRGWSSPDRADSGSGTTSVAR